MMLYSVITVVFKPFNFSKLHLHEKPFVLHGHHGDTYIMWTCCHDVILTKYTAIQLGKSNLLAYTTASTCTVGVSTQAAPPHNHEV